MVWYSHLFQNCPQFIVIHTVKGFGIVNKAEIDVFSWTLLLFWWSSGCWQFDLFSLPFLNPALTSGNSEFTYCWSLPWRIFSITLLACEMSAIVQYFENSLVLPFFGIGMKTDLFQSCGHCWVFQIAGIFSAALSQHHLLEFEIAQLESHHLGLRKNRTFSERPSDYLS